MLDVIGRLPRHLFIEEALASRAYEDTALPIGLGQTISQPWVVARMTEAIIEYKVPEKVLEIGTGSGYQAAVLAALVKNRYTPSNASRNCCATRGAGFRKLGIDNIRSKHDDGKLGWPEHAPFDAIMLTAAGDHIDARLDRTTRAGWRHRRAGRTVGRAAAQAVPARRGRDDRRFARRGEFRSAAGRTWLMRLFKPIYEAALKWAAHPKAEWFLVGLSFVEAFIFPIAPEVMLAPMTLAKPQRWARYATISLACSMLGSFVGYALGHFAFQCGASASGRHRLAAGDSKRKSRDCRA